MESSKPTLCHPLLQFLHQTGASLGSVKGAQRIPPPPLGLHPPPVLLASFKAHTAQKGHLYHERRLFFPLLQSSGWQKLNTNILGVFFSSENSLALHAEQKNTKIGKKLVVPEEQILPLWEGMCCEPVPFPQGCSALS